MKNILFVIPTLRMGGAEKALISLLKSLDKNLVSVDLFLFEGGGILQNEVPEWVNIIEADEVTRAMTLEARFYLKQIAKKGYVLPTLSRIWISTARKLGIKLFSWNVVKKYIPEIKKKYDVAIGFLEGAADYFVIDKVQAEIKIGWIHIDLSSINLHEKEIQYYNSFDNLVTISEKCLEYACQTIPEISNKISVIKNVVSEQYILNRASETVDINWDFSLCNLLTVGRLEYQKGIDIAARAAKALRDKGVRFRWHVFGIGSMESNIKNYISDNDLNDVFSLDGLVSNPYPYMKQADIIVQPSRWEGKSIVLDEAKILGKAIVVTNYPSVDDQIIDRVTGIIVDTDPMSITDGIELLINDSVLKSELEINCSHEKGYNEAIINDFYNIIRVK